MRDANDTHFHLLLGQSDWEEAAFSPEEKDKKDLRWEPERHGVRLTPEVFLFTASPGDRPPVIADRRGAGRDRHGNWYFIDRARARVRVTSTGSGVTTDFWPLPAAPCGERRDGGFRPRTPETAPPGLHLDALVATTDHRLVVFAYETGRTPTTGEPKRHNWLLVFDLLEGGPPEMQAWPGDIDLEPLDAAPRPSGGLWLLDRKNRRLWLFDRHLRVVLAAAGLGTTPHPGDFRPRANEPDDPRPVPTRTVHDTDALRLDALEFIAVEAVDDDRVLLLERGDRSRIHGLRRDGSRWRQDPVELDLTLVLAATDLAPAAARHPEIHDIALVSRRRADGSLDRRLYAASALGNQAFRFKLDALADDFALEPEPAYVPMRAFSGQGIVADGDSVWYPSADRFVPLKEQRRARYRRHGVLTTPPASIAPSGRAWFDGREPDCVWHRLMLDARIPHGCAITVESRAARTPAELAVQAWRAEPALCRRARGSELPWTRPADDVREGTWELLFQHARGRYLQLRLTLTGDGTASPTLRALRAWYPRFSYLERYLPAVYREDAVSAAFLERFLANAEGTFTAIEDRIAAAQALFDPRTLPEDFLPWLLGWFGAEAEILPDARRRALFIKHAITLYRARGTAPGVAMALRLALEPGLTEEALLSLDTAPRRGIRVVEQFRQRNIKALRAGDPKHPDGSPVVPTIPPAANARADAIARRYGDTLAKHSESTDVQNFPLAPPLLKEDDTDLASKWHTAWEQVARDELGFVPAIAAVTGDAARHARARWQAFLRRRYRTPEALRAVYGQQITDFAAVELPTVLPRTPEAVRDWYDYETVVLARSRRAHWFTVQLPITTTELASWRETMARREVAERVIELQKPAHTIFDVRLFWSLFRVGDARLGLDTVLEAGARALAPAIADASWIGEGHLAGANEGIPGVSPAERPVLR